MLNKQIVEWIKSEEAQGYTEEQLKEYLLKQGYKTSDIIEAINESKGNPSAQGNSFAAFNQFLAQKGILFQVLFYISVSLFVIPSIIEVIILSIRMQFFSLIFPALLLGVVFLAMKKRKIYALLFIIYAGYPLILATLPLVQSFMTIGSITVYISISLFSALIGLFMAYMFSKVCDTFKRYVATGVVFSCFLAFIFAINSLVGEIINRLAQQMEQVAEAGTAGATAGLVTMFNPITTSANFGFVLSIILFNAPFFYFYFKRKDINKKLFLLYLIPAGLFIILSLLIGALGNLVMKSPLI